MKLTIKKTNELLNKSGTWDTALFLFDNAIHSKQFQGPEEWILVDKKIKTEEDLLEFIERLQCIQ
jgi:hypothetical protein